MGTITAFLFGIGVGAVGTLIITLWFVVNRAWRYAKFAGAPVPWLGVLGMRIRGTPPDLVVDSYVALRKRGHDLPWQRVEVVFLAHRDPRMPSSRLTQLVEQHLDSNAA